MSCGNTIISRMNYDLKAEKRKGKSSQSDFSTDFYQVMSGNNSENLKRYSLFPSSSTEKRNSDLTAKKLESNQQKVNNHTSSDNSRGVTKQSESGQTVTDTSTPGVDENETDIQSGASTEAAVNAQSKDSVKNDKESPSTSSPQEAADKLSEELSESLKLEIPSDIAQASQTQSESDQSTETEVKKNTKFSETLKQQLSAKIIEAKSNENALSASTLTQQKIIFETGLAEHFIRLLTEQFSEVNQLLSNQSQKSKNQGSRESQSNSGDVQTANFVADMKAVSSKSASTANSSQSSSGQSLTQTNGQQTVDRVLQIIRSNIGQRNSQMTVRLDPPELGRMKMDIRLIDNQLHLSIVTETAEAKDILSQRLDTLKQNLEQNGIQIAKVEISTRPSEQTNGQNSSDRQGQQPFGDHQSFQQHTNSRFQHQSFSNEQFISSESFDSVTSSESSEDIQTTVLTRRPNNRTLNLVA